MRMRPHQFLRRAVPALAVVTGLALVGSAAPGTAAPPVRPGNVTGLSVDKIVKPAAQYKVPAAWTAASRATSYRVALVTAAGTTLDSGTVTDSRWTASTVASPGTSVRVRVTPYAGTRRGKVAQSAATILPDLTAPTGTYDVVVGPDGQTATVNESALSDDLTPPGSVRREIDWGESVEPTWVEWSAGTSIAHVYPPTEMRYEPRIRLTDQAGNDRILTLRAVVVNDVLAPTGTFTLTPPAAWAKLTRVQISQGALVDNWTPGNLIERRVDWGDGTPLVVWKSGTVLAHVYQRSGPFAPTVTVTDEALNGAQVAVGAVTVKADTARPVVRLKLPRTGRTMVRRWTILRGTAKDSGTGVSGVRVRAVERRGGVWYAFKPGTKRWVKAGPTKAAAMRRAGVRVVRPTATGAWTARLPRLAKGKLAYRVVARDRVRNYSKPVTRAQLLTRR